jgi:hypothetical protein
MDESAVLEMIAEKHAVTITVQDGAAVLRGFTPTVKKAAEDVRSYVLGPPLSSKQLKSRTSSQTSITSVSTAAPDGGDEQQKHRSDSQSSMGSAFTVLSDSGEDDLSRWQPTSQVVDVMRIPQTPHDLSLDLLGNHDSSCDGPEDIQFVMLKRRPPGLSPCCNTVQNNLHTNMKPGACYIRLGSLETSCAPDSYPSGSTTIVYE